MKATPDGLETRPVVDALRDGWDYEAHIVEYAAVGAGSYHWDVADADGNRAFVTIDDLDTKTWLGDEREASFDGLRDAFDTSVALRRQGLDFVIAPIPARDGTPLRRIDARYALALFPFVVGEPGDFGYFEDDPAGRAAVVARLAELHAAASGSAARTTGFDLPGRRHLEEALRDLGEPWTGGPLSESAREAIAASAPVLKELLLLADRLCEQAKSRAGDWVVTHGEPHAGNAIQTDAGYVLVDWDTVALGPRERDMWMLAAGGAEAVELYADASGVRLDEAALDFFRLTWELKDLAEYLNVLRSPHQENDDTVRQYGALKSCGVTRDDWAALLD
jgi:spectinomycin phosphotransferase